MAIFFEKELEEAIESSALEKDGVPLGHLSRTDQAAVLNVSRGWLDRARGGIMVYIRDAERLAEKLRKEAPKSLYREVVRNTTKGPGDGASETHASSATKAELPSLAPASHDGGAGRAREKSRESRRLRLGAGPRAGYLFPRDAEPLSFTEVHFELDPRFDLVDELPEVQAAWRRYTLRPDRKASYENFVYRIVGEPRFQGGKLSLPIARLRYSTALASRTTDPLFESAKAELKTVLASARFQLSAVNRGALPPARSIGDENAFPVFAPSTFPLVALGVEVLVITRDRRFLLRRRSAMHDLAVNKWGTSFAGYILRRDENNLLVDPLETILREAQQELNRTIEARLCRCIGLHFNPVDMTMDLLTVYPAAEETSLDFCRSLAPERTSTPSDGMQFRSTARFQEIHVKDQWNVFLPFDQEALKNFVSEQVQAPCDDELVVEAHANLMRSLRYRAALIWGEPPSLPT